MTSVDWLILVVLALSIAYGVWRGLVREVFALVGWIAAFVLAAWFGSSAAAWLPAHWSDAVRGVVGHAAVFVLVLLIAALGGWALSRIVRAAGLGPADRTFGGVFGTLRGMLIVLAVTILASLTNLPRTEAWKSSVLMPYVRIVLDTVRPWLPEGASRVAQTADGGVHSTSHRLEGVGICAESSAS